MRVPASGARAPSGSCSKVGTAGPPRRTAWQAPPVRASPPVRRRRGGRPAGPWLDGANASRRGPPPSRRATTPGTWPGLLRAALRSLGRARGAGLLAARRSRQIMSAQATEVERAAEAALRPRRLAEASAGQPVVRDQLAPDAADRPTAAAGPRAAVRSARARQDHTRHDHRGRGRRRAAAHVRSRGPARRGPRGDPLGVAGGRRPVHRRYDRWPARPRRCSTWPWRTTGDIVVGKGAGATAIPLTLPPFTVVGGDHARRPPPARPRDRFGFTGHLEFYDVAIQARAAPFARLLGAELEPTAATEIASRLPGTPRIANRLAPRAGGPVRSGGSGDLDLAAARAALRVFEVDERGLTAWTGRRRRPLPEVRGRTGRPHHPRGRGGEEPGNPSRPLPSRSWVREGLMSRTARGRVADPAGFSSGARHRRGNGPVD